MASQTDITNALMQLVQDAAYPNGTNQPSIVGVPVKIITGWPNPIDLQKAQAGEHVLVSVYRATAKKTLYSLIGKWTQTSIVVSSLFLTVTGNTVTVTGTVFTPAICLIKVNGTPYIYTVLNTDTLNSIAANLSALIPNSTVNNNVITINNAYKIETQIGVTATAKRLVGDIQENYWLDVWSGNNENRQIMADALLIALRINYRFTVAGNEQASIGSDYDKKDFDKSQKVGVYRANISFFVAYSLTQSATFPTILDTELNLSTASHIN